MKAFSKGGQGEKSHGKTSAFDLDDSEGGIGMGINKRFF
jgi:hypothetical protein